MTVMMYLYSRDAVVAPAAAAAAAPLLGVGGGIAAAAVGGIQHRPRAAVAAAVGGNDVDLLLPSRPSPTLRWQKKRRRYSTPPLVVGHLVVGVDNHASKPLLLLLRGERKRLSK